MKIKTLLERHTVYKALLLAVTLVSTVGYARQFLAPCYRLLLAAGGVLLICDLVRKRIRWKDAGLWLLAGFLALYLVSIYVNRDAELVKNLKAFAYMAVCLGVFFGTGSRGTAEERRREAMLLGNITLVLTALILLGSIAAFLMGLEGTYTLADGTTGFLGTDQNRLNGLVYTNTGGAMAAIAIVITLGYIRGGAMKRRPAAILLCCSLMIDYLYLVLSYSRTSIYALAAAMFAGVFWLTGTSDGKLWRHAFVRLAAALLTAALIAGLSGPLKDILWDLEGAAAYQAAEAETSARAASSSVDMEEIRHKINSILTGRLDLWTAGIRVAAEHPAFGITYERIVPEVKKIFPGEGLNWEDGGVHSIYLSVILASGLAGALALTAFTAVQAGGLITSRKEWKRRPSPAFTGALMIVLVSLLMELAESRILYRFNYFFVIFWIAMSMVRDETEAMNANIRFSSAKRAGV